MIDRVNLSQVCEALSSAPPDRPFATRGKVTKVKRVRGSCYFTLAEGDARLQCALLRQSAAQTDFWVASGQIVEVDGYAECFRGQWQLLMVAARLVRGEPGWPRGYRYRSARQVVALFDAVMDTLFGPRED